MNKKERYSIIAAALERKRHTRLPASPRIVSKRFLIFRSIGHLKSRVPDKLIKRGRPNNSRSRFGRTVLPLFDSAFGSTRENSTPAPKRPGHPRKYLSARLSDVRRHPLLPPHPLEAFIEEAAASLPDSDDFALLVADASPFLAALAEDGAPLGAEYSEELALQFDRTADLVGYSLLRCRLGDGVFALCLPKRLLSECCIRLLSTLPVCVGEKIIDVRFALSVGSVSPDPMLRPCIFAPGLSRVRGSDGIDACISRFDTSGMLGFELGFSPVTDSASGSPSLIEAIPYLLFPGNGMAMMRSVVPTLKSGSTLAAEALSVAFRRISDMLTASAAKGVYLPMLLELRSVCAAGNELCALKTLKEGFGRLPGLTSPLVIGLGADDLEFCGAAAEYGFRSAADLTPGELASLDLPSLKAKGLDLIKLSADALSPGSDASALLKRPDSLGIRLILKAPFGGLRAEWAARGAVLFQNGFAASLSYDNAAEVIHPDI